MHIINYPKLAEIFHGKTDRVDLLVNALKKRLPEWIVEIQESPGSTDPDSLRKACHRIRGAAATITAEKLEDAAKKLGDIIKENRPEEIAPAYDHLMVVIKELEEYTQQ